jgi:vibriolysin
VKSPYEKMIKAVFAGGLAAAAAFAAAPAFAAPVVSDNSAFPQLESSALLSKTPSDIKAAVAAMGHAEIVETARDGMPTFLRGDLGRVGNLQFADSARAASLVGAKMGQALKAFRLTPADLTLRKMNVDGNGNRHMKYGQTFRGLEVVGGDLIVHVDSKGMIYAMNGTARGGATLLSQRDIGESAARSFAAAAPDYAGMTSSAGRLVYLITADGGFYKTYETTVTGTRGKDPVVDKVYVNATNGKIVSVHPQVYFVENRRVYSANNGTTLPGTLRRTEGQAATTDVDVNAAYDGTGDTYEAYKAFWNRDSYNNAGATLTSSVHYSTNYCNAYWNSTQMVFGDGNSSQGCLPLARGIDVTGHELTHAVTENESALVYSGQSGGLNEALSDIFGAFVESYVDGGKTGSLPVTSDTWAVGEDILPPGLRFMNDPAKDGQSLDFYTSTAGNVDVHLSSGIANLAFYLLSQGGTHPRGKSTVAVTGVGLAKAIRIFYEAQINVLTANSTFLAAGNATVLAAQNLGYSVADQTSVANAWQAVGVAVPTPGGTGGGGTGDTVLTSGVPVTGISGATSSQKFYALTVPSGQSSLTFTISGGTGDVDMYTRLGSHPTTTTYDCRPFVTGNNETCTVTNPAAGTYYVLLNGYATYSGVTLTGTYSGTTTPPGDGVPVLSNGVGVSASGASGSSTYWKIQVPAGVRLTLAISGGTGDADLYTRFGSQPTTTTYDCRPYLNGNNETCTVTSTQAGYYYILVRGFSAYSGLTVRASY